MKDLILNQSRSGKAVFANKNFQRWELIMEFKTKIFSGDELPILYDAVEDYYLQVGPNLYMGPSNGIDNYFNHSCDPNAGLRFSNQPFKVLLIVIKNIRRGEEITFDYSTTMDEDGWEMDCLCGSRKCRKRIRDFKYLPKRIQQRYIKLGIVPGYILKNLKKKRI